MCTLPFPAKGHLLGFKMGVSDRPHSELVSSKPLTFRALGNVTCSGLVANDSLTGVSGWSCGGISLVL